MALYLPKKNTFGDLFGAAQLTVPYGICIEVFKQDERKERKETLSPQGTEGLLARVIPSYCKKTP